MQNENKMLLPLNALKNHKKVTSLYLALLCGAVSAAVWPSASNYRLYESLKMHQWCFDWHLTFPLLLRLAGEQQCHEWITYPHKTLSKNTHIYCTRKDALNQNTILSYWCAFQWKISSFPHSTQLSIWKLS